MEWNGMGMGMSMSMSMGGMICQIELLIERVVIIHLLLARRVVRSTSRVFLFFVARGGGCSDGGRNGGERGECG